MGTTAGPGLQVPQRRPIDNRAVDFFWLQAFDDHTALFSRIQSRVERLEFMIGNDADTTDDDRRNGTNDG